MVHLKNWNKQLVKFIGLLGEQNAEIVKKQSKPHSPIEKITPNHRQNYEFNTEGTRIYTVNKNAKNGRIAEFFTMYI